MTLAKREPKPNYMFLSKTQRHMIDLIDPDTMSRLLAEQTEISDDLFAWILGILADYKRKGGRLSPDQKKCLRMPSLLYKALEDK